MTRDGNDLSDVFLDELAPPEQAHRRESRRAREVRRRRRRRRTVMTLLASVLLVGAVAVVAFFGARPVIEALRGADGGPEDYPGPGSGEVVVTVEEGSTGQDIGSVLVEHDVVASVRAFTEAFSANPSAASIQPGAYNLRQQMAAQDAVAALLDPASRAEVSITIPEGFRADQVYERVASVAGLPVAEVQAAASDPAAIGLPAEAGGNPEGWFAAATYAFQPDTDAGTILRTMLEHTVTLLDELGVPAEQRQTVLTKASIVEREVNIDEYYGQVARVIDNRLAEDSQTAGLLNMDSTVLYGVGRSGGMPTAAELEDPSNPYNTYRHQGLPPTPIGAPGRRALEAVVDPPEGDWLYFVTVNLDTGETKFASSYAEHQTYVAELQRWLEENPDWEGGGGG